MHLFKEHMRPVDELVEEVRKEATAANIDREVIPTYIIGHLKLIIKDFQKFVTDLQEQVKPQ